MCEKIKRVVFESERLGNVMLCCAWTEDFDGNVTSLTGYDSFGNPMPTAYWNLWNRVVELAAENQTHLLIINRESDDLILWSKIV
jgi:hypothetical protein